MVSKEHVMKALSKVIDPEIGISIVDLGLIYDVKIKDSEVGVNMTLTSPGCPVAPQIMAAAEAQILKLKGIKKASVDFVFDPPWSLEKLSDEAKMHLGL